MPKIIICRECKEKKKHKAKGLCSKCYQKTPKHREYKREYRKTPKYREYQREYQKTPKHREYQREYEKTRRKKALEKVADRFDFIKDKEAFILDGVILENRLMDLKKEGKK